MLQAVRAEYAIFLVIWHYSNTSNKCHRWPQKTNQPGYRRTIIISFRPSLRHCQLTLESTWASCVSTQQTRLLSGLEKSGDRPSLSRRSRALVPREVITIDFRPQFHLLFLLDKVLPTCGTIHQWSNGQVKLRWHEVNRRQCKRSKSDSIQLRFQNEIINLTDAIYAFNKEIFTTCVSPLGDFSYKKSDKLNLSSKLLCATALESLIWVIQPSDAATRSLLITTSIRFFVNRGLRPRTTVCNWPASRLLRPSGCCNQ